MNGDTKNKIQGVFIGAAVSLFIFLLTATFGYGHLNGKVDSVQRRISCIEDIRERLVKVETIVTRIDETLSRRR